MTQRKKFIYNGQIGPYEQSIRVYKKYKYLYFRMAEIQHIVDGGYGTVPRSIDRTFVRWNSMYIFLTTTISYSDSQFERDQSKKLLDYIFENVPCAFEKIDYCTADYRGINGFDDITDSDSDDESEED